MNEIIMTALAEALTAVTEAGEAAADGRFTEARDLLAIMEEKLAEGEGGNAAHAARRRKILRLEAEVRAALPKTTAEVTTEVATEAAQDAPTLPTEAPAAADVVEEPQAEPASPVETPAAAAAAVEVSTAQPAPAKTRQVAPPLALSAEQWALVAQGLTAAGESAEGRAAEAAQFEAQQQEARIAKETFRAKVFEGQALQARAEAAALAGDVDAANSAWDRLFDVVTAIRSLEGGHRRKNGGVADPVKAAAYDAARAGRLKITQWAQGKGL